MNYLRATGEALSGVALLAGVLAGCGSVPPAPAPSSSPTPVASPAPAPPLATPLGLDVPALGIAGAPLIPLGLLPDGHIAVPSLDTPLQGGYWRPEHATVDTPTVLLAHINAHGHPGLFVHLAQLAAGDLVVVHRADGTATTYRIGGVTAVRKAGWTRTDTQTVYGEQDAPTLRLVSCGGPFDPVAHSYRDNLIAQGGEQP